MHEPYIVIGVGRCGTSVVARILHTKLGVFMGYRFPSKGGRDHPEGFWEDTEFLYLNNDFIHGKIAYTEWVRETEQVIRRRQALNRPWGIKEPRTGYFFGLFLSLFKEPKIIYCVRKKSLVIDSLVLHNYGSKETSEGYFEKQTKRIEQALSHLTLEVLRVRFGEERRSDESIIRRLTGRWGELKELHKKVKKGIVRV